MRVLCTGWVEPRHDPITLREVEPIEDRRVSHGMCSSCESAMIAEDAKEATSDRKG